MRSFPRTPSNFFHSPFSFPQPLQIFLFDSRCRHPTMLAARPSVRVSPPNPKSTRPHKNLRRREGDLKKAVASQG